MMDEIIEQKSLVQEVVEKIITDVAESKRSTPARRVTRGPERTGLRIVYSVAGEDGHAPLDVYGRPYVRGPMCGPYAGDITGFEYRTRDAQGCYVPHDYAMVLRAFNIEGGNGNNTVSWAYTPVADEIVEEAEVETVQVEIPGAETTKLVKGKAVVTKAASTFVAEERIALTEDGSPKYKAPTVTGARNGVIDGMLDLLKQSGLVHAYWTSLEALEADTSTDAEIVMKMWPKEWYNVDEKGNATSRKILDIS